MDNNGSDYIGLLLVFICILYMSVYIATDIYADFINSGVIGH